MVFESLDGIRAVVLGENVFKAITVDDGDDEGESEEESTSLSDSASLRESVEVSISLSDSMSDSVDVSVTCSILSFKSVVDISLNSACFE